MTLCIGQLHPITVYRIVLGCALFWCWVSLCAPFTLSLIDLYFVMIFIVIIVTIIAIFIANILIFNYTFRFSVSKWIGFCECETLRIFPLLNTLLEYWIKHVTFGLFSHVYINTRIFYRGVPGFAIDCPCSVWCCALTTCLLYVGPIFRNLLLLIKGL